MPERSKLYKLLATNGAVLVGILVVIIADVVRISKAFEPAADPFVEIARFLGLMLFFTAVIFRLISLEHRTQLAYEQHARMFEAIESVQVQAGLRPLAKPAQDDHKI